MTQYVKEQQEKNILPKLQDIPYVSEYDIIFVSTPVWWGKMSLPVASFLKSTQPNGKVVVPFVTHEGNGESGIGEAIKQAPGCRKVLPSLIIKGSEIQTSENAVKKFADDLKA